MKTGVTIIFLFCCLACSTNSEKTKEKANSPNIILLLVDDMGYGDLTCYGGQAVYTPNIDQLAHAGVRFTRFYSASGVCTPSRAAILTGKYPLRFNIRQHFSDKGENLPAGIETLPKILKKAGYATAHIGKWHLGGLRTEDFEARKKGKEADPGPLQHGFDHSLTSIEGAPPRPLLIKERKLYREGGKYMVRNDQRAPEDPNHWTNIKVNEAIKLLEGWKENDQAFFLNLWFDVPHTPYEPAPEPHLSTYANMGATGDQLYFRSMVSNLDENIGRLITKLKELDLYENTLILFTSDNGAAWEGEVGPFKGGKTDLHEGGIRVPFIAVWQNKIPGNHVSFQRGHHTDILPTICEAVHADYKESIDGMSLLPNLCNGEEINRGLILWQMDIYKSLQRHYEKPEPYGTNIAYKGPWKLLLDSITPVELYHLENDPHEVLNVLGKYPEIVNNLREETILFMSEPRNSWN
jgi:arylsulfatase A-like enzyme